MALSQHVPPAETEEHAALIAALDAGDLTGDDLARARRLADACVGCAALAMDLAAIRSAMASLPVPARRRDYRLTEADAAALRPSTWRRVLDWLAAPGSSVRPLATGLAALGVVGVLLTAGVPSFGSAGAAPELSASGAPTEDSGPAQVLAQSPDRFAAPSAAASAGPATAASAAPAPVAGAAGVPSAAPSFAPAAAPSAAPGDEPIPGAIAGEGASPAPAGDRSSTAGAPEGSAGAKSTPAYAADTSATTSVPYALVASIALLLTGLGLFLARALARRRAA